MSLLAAACSSHPPAHDAATLILHGGRVWTGSAAAPEVSAVAVRGNRIVLCGSDREALAVRGDTTTVINLEGRRVVPGFIDSHLHFLSGGDELLGADLRSARNVEEFAARLGAIAAKLPPGAWITSGTWDHENWPGGELPRREALDRHTPQHPVLVSRLDGHMAVANSLALRTAGVTRDTPDPPGGLIVRDPRSGEPTGVLKDAAEALVARHVPAWSAQQRIERARAALAHARSLGVTTVHDMPGSLADVEAYRELRRRGELTARVRLYTPITALAERRALAASLDPNDLLLRLAGVKGFADGSLGSSTALFFEPYDDAPANSGLALADLSPGGGLQRLTEDCARSGIQVAVHGIGDKAIRSLLDIYERAGGSDCSRFRFRIEHAQHIHPDDLGRFARLGVIASMQPAHAIDDGRWAQKRIGIERCRTTYAFRSLLDRGARLAFGTDWPVAPLSPLLAIYAAVTRRTTDGANPDGWIAEEKISVAEALRAYTLGGAYAGRDEEHLGSIEAGKLADLAVLSADPFAVRPEEIQDIRVELTVVDGQVVYRRAMDGEGRAEIDACRSATRSVSERDTPGADFAAGHPRSASQVER
jgi:hypothetical protein